MSTPHPLPGLRKPHVSLVVRDVDASVAFHRTLSGVALVKHYRGETTMHSLLQDDHGHDSRRTHTGHAKFDLVQPAPDCVLNEMPGHAPGRGGTLSHLGLQLEDIDAVLAVRGRIVAAGLQPCDEMRVNCCHARQDKSWLADPDGNAWEILTMLEHLGPELLRQLDQRDTATSPARATREAAVARPACCAA